MTIYVGGLRSRLVRESVAQMTYDALEALGWFDTNRKHLPINFVSTGIDDSETVPKNTLSLADWDVAENEQEMGSALAEHRRTYYLDFYAENDAIGLHMGDDLKDILGGRMPSIGRSGPNVTCYDYSAATPIAFAFVEIENIVVDRPSAFERPWMRYLRTVRFEVVDYYGTDADNATEFDDALTDFDDPDSDFDS